MSSEESNKMSKKIPSQDSNSDEIEWDYEEMKKSIMDSAVDYDKLVGLLIESIKDQQKQIDELKNKLSE